MKDKLGTIKTIDSKTKEKPSDDQLAVEMACNHHLIYTRVEFVEKSSLLLKLWG